MSKIALFDKAIELFALYGYENTSISDIASAAGIKEGAFYTHFAGKEDLLHEIYNYYEEHYFMNVKPLDSILDILKCGTAEEIMKAVAWNFYGMPEKIHQNMTSITRIVYARFLADDRANRIFVNMMTKDTIEDIYLKLEKLKEFHRLRDDNLDLISLAEMIVYSGLMTGIVGISNSYKGGIIDGKMYLKDMIADYLEQNIL